MKHLEYIVPKIATNNQNSSVQKYLLLLALRTGLFLLFQGMIAVILFALSGNTSWEATIAWWPLVAIMANIVLLLFLAKLNKQEGGSIRHLYSFRRDTALQDFLVAIGVVIIALLLVTLFNTIGMRLLFGASIDPTQLMFQRLPFWAKLIQLAFFPITVALLEMPWYYGYLMPRIHSEIGKSWIAVVLCGFWFSIQHAALPLIFDARFIIWRAFMMLPFTLFLGLVLTWRKRLMPYFMLTHFFLDLAFAFLLFKL